MNSKTQTTNKQKIHVVYGDNPTAMTVDLLKQMNPQINIPKDALIGIKPNLVVSKPASSGATTHPQIVEAIIAHLQSRQFTNIAILESAWIGDNTQRAFDVCGYTDLAQKTGVTLIDLDKDSTKRKQAGGISMEVCETALQVDYLINVPVLKAHCQTKLTCALKNLKGCIPDSEKSNFHQTGLFKPIAALNAILKTDLIIVDGMNGDLTFEEGGNPVAMNRVIGGTDPVLVDAYAAGLIGYKPTDIKYIPLAEKLQIGSMNLTNADIKTHGNAKTTSSVRPTPPPKFKTIINAQNACSPCYGSLIHAMTRLPQSKIRQLKQVCIGQEFVGRSKEGLGIGHCTNKFKRSLKGCPPTADEIITFLKNNT